MKNSWRTRTSGSKKQKGKKFQLKPSRSKIGKGITGKQKRRVFNYDRPRRIFPMLAKRGSVAQLKDPNYVSQIKFDGTAIIVIKNGNKIILRGRSWKTDFAKDDRFPELVKAVQRIKTRRGVWHAELVFYDKKTGKEVFLTALAKPETKANLNAVLEVHDVLYVNNRNVKEKDYDERLDILDDTIPRMKHLRRARTFRTEKAKERNYKEALRRKREGVMIKALDAPYEEGVRSGAVLKLKKMYTKGADTADVIVIGVTKGRGKREKMFGALILAQYKRGKLVLKGRTSGFSDKKHAELLRILKRLKRKTNPLDVRIPDAKFFVKPHIVVEVKFHEQTKHGHFRHPTFERIRDDISARQCKV